ncbi:oligoendopeptidase F [Clostridiales bacterium COT073_COT-073]|nr:oligoendopeptidase F [Clostridiales bacterium COT073_COT-073]
MAPKILNRSEMTPEFTWDLTHIVADDPAWYSLYAECENMIVDLQKQESFFLTSAENLYQFLSTKSKLDEAFGRVYGYAQMGWHQDTSDAAKQELAQKSESLAVLIQSKLSFVEPLLLTLSQDTLNEYFAEKPELEVYRQYFDNLFRTQLHVLPKEQEEILAMVGDVTSGIENTFAIFNNADIRFDPIIDENGEALELTHGNYVSTMESNHRQVRKAAFQSMYAAYKRNINTLASVYAMNLKSHLLNAKARKFDSTCEASLFANNIPVSVYDQLIENINEHLPLLHRYMALRKKMLNLPELHMYDIYAPLLPDNNITISFAQAKETVLKAIAPMGEKYVSVVKQAFAQRWLDVYENKGKRSGAYSWGVYGVHPYVLLNHSDNLNNMFTLAHEMGHAMHSYLSNEAQAYVNHDYSIFLAEIASTCNENLLIQYLLKNTDDKNLKLAYMTHFLEGFRGTIFRQTMFAEYERATHQLVEQGEAVTAEKLSQMYYELNQKYHGPSMISDEEIRYEWARIPHFYYDYYVFQYATGLISSVAIADMILSEGQSAVDRYTKEFLSAGSSKYPLDILKATGVDITQKEPTIRAMKVFEEMLSEMEKLV